MHYPRTPDDRYFVVRGRLWRCSDPSLAEEDRERLVRELMDARRLVKQAKRNADEELLAKARSCVHTAKVALGERGPTWWDDDTDFNRRLVHNTPYADWWEGFGQADLSIVSEPPVERNS